MKDRISPLRLAITGAVTLLILFVLCWVGASVPLYSPSHMFVALFTLAPVTSWYALCQGSFGALVFGAAGGAILAWVYNASASFERKV